MSFYSPQQQRLHSEVDGNRVAPPCRAQAVAVPGRPSSEIPLGLPPAGGISKESETHVTGREADTE